MKVVGRRVGLARHSWRPSARRRFRLRAPAGGRLHARVASRHAPLTADAVARQIQDRNTGRDSRSSMRMKLFDRHNRVRERALSHHRAARPRRSGRPAHGARRRSTAHPLHLSRTTSAAPASSSGNTRTPTTSASCICRRSGAFAGLPAAKHRRASSAATSPTRTSAAASSTTTLRLRRPDGQTATWTPPGGGAARPAWRLDRAGRTRPPSFRASCRSSSRTFVVVGADVYNRRNEKQKVYTVRRVEQVEGIWTVMDSEMTNGSRRHAPSSSSNRRTTTSVSRRPTSAAGSSKPRSSEPSRSPAGSTAGAFRSRSSSCSARCCRRRAPTSRTIDNDITAWFSKADPVYQDYERFRAEFGGTRALIIAIKADSPDRLFSRETLRVDRRDHRRHRARRHRAAGQQPGHRDDRRGAAERRGAATRAGSKSGRCSRTSKTRDPADIKRRALEDDLIRGDLVSDDGATTAIIVGFDEDRIDDVRAGVIQQIHDIVDPKLPAGVRAYYNGSLEISETYNRITLDNQRKFTPPILLFTVRGDLPVVPVVAQDHADDVRGPDQPAVDARASTR